MNGTEVNSTEMIKDIYEIQFPELGWKFHIDPTAFTIAGIDIQWYALIIISGLLLAMLYCFPRMKKFGVDSDKAIDAVIGGVIGGIIGLAAVCYNEYNFRLLFTECWRKSDGRIIEIAEHWKSCGRAAESGRDLDRRGVKDGWSRKYMAKDSEVR